MSQNLQLVLVVALSIGCGALATLAFQAQPVQAQNQTFRRCFIARQASADVDDAGEISRPGSNRIINIPPGWTVAGGGMAGYDGGVLLCSTQPSRRR